MRYAKRMKLRKWREHNQLSVDQLSRQLGVPVSTLYCYENGSRRPRSEVARRIEAFTNGEVTAAELLGIAGGVGEEKAPFAPAPDISAEARELGLDPEAIAAKAVEDAVKTERLRRWNEDNRDAIESWNELVEREGLWSDGLRAF